MSYMDTGFMLDRYIDILVTRGKRGAVGRDRDIRLGVGWDGAVSA